MYKKFIFLIIIFIFIFIIIERSLGFLIFLLIYFGQKKVSVIIMVIVGGRRFRVVKKVI